MAEKISLISPLGNLYKVGKLIRETENDRVYECFLNDKWYLLKVAKTHLKNHLIDKEELFLNDLLFYSQRIEKQHAESKGGEKVNPLNNHFFFPIVKESFIATDHGNRSVLILDMSHVADFLSDLTPLSFIVERDRVAVDPRTSAWIMGKLLKMLTFTHGKYALINKINLSNILINKKKHYVLIFDWSMATEGVDAWSVSPEQFASEISACAQVIMRCLGCNIMCNIPENSQLSDKRYEDHLKYLLNGQESSAHLAHRKFYKLIYELWPRGFHPYTTKELN